MNHQTTQAIRSGRSGQRCALWLGVWVLAAVLIPAGRTDATNGIEPIGVSTQARARAGIDVAVGDSALSQVDNPATLRLSPRDAYRLDFAGQIILPQCKWEGPIHDASSKVCWIPLANFGLAIPIDEKWTVGVAVHSKAGVGSRYYMRHLLIPFMKREVYSSMQDVAVIFDAAYAVTDELSIGAGIRAEGATAKFSSVLGPADVDFGRGCAWGGGFSLGLHWRPREDLSFGAGYRSPTWFGDLSGGHLKASLFGLLPLDLGYGSLASSEMPQRISAGAAWDITDWFKLVGETRWINWSDSIMDELTVRGDRPINFGVPLPLGYEDQWVFAVGGEFALDKAKHWKLGTGYMYATCPVPPENLFPFTSVVAQHHVTIGLRYERDNWWVGGGYIWSLGCSLEGRGKTEIPLGVDYAFSRVEQMQHHVSFGFGFSW